MTEIRNIKVTIEEKNLIINNGADKLPLNPTSQGFSGQSVRKQLAQAVTGARGSVLALMIEKFSIIEDFSNTVLLVEVKVVGDDLTFVYADGREFKFPLDVLTNGLGLEQKTDKVEIRQVGETIITYENGVIVSMSSDNVVESIEYDANGEVDKVTSSYADGKVYEETYTKDVNGNITKIMKVEVI